MENFNFTSLCGTATMDIWNAQTHSLGLCFLKLFLITPVFGLFAVTSAYFIGRQSDLVSRCGVELVMIYWRAFISFAMMIFTVLVEPIVLLILGDEPIYFVDAIAFGVQVSH